MDFGVFDSITPLGNLNPPGHTFPTGHMYFSLPSEETGGTGGPFGDGRIFPAQNVYAATDARVAQVSITDVTSTLAGEPETYKEFGMRLELCDGTQLMYGHIGPLSERLESLPTGEPLWCNDYATGKFAVKGCTYSPGWPVEAGELIAYTSGRAAAFDFGAKTHIGNTGGEISGCPLDLYGDEMRSRLEALLGDGSVIRTAEPVCGTVYQEVEGTAQGRWYKTLEGHPIEDQNVALVYDNFDPSIPVFSIGTKVPGLQSGTYRFAPRESGSVNRHFADVTPASGVNCFEGLSDRWGNVFAGLVFLVEMPNDTTLRIEAVQQASCGSGSWSLSGTAATYLR